MKKIFAFLLMSLLVLSVSAGIYAGVGDGTTEGTDGVQSASSTDYANSTDPRQVPNLWLREAHTNHNPAYPGSILDITITVRNLGPELHNAVIKEAAPQWTKFIEEDDNGNEVNGGWQRPYGDENLFIYNLGTVDAGNAEVPTIKEIHFKVRVMYQYDPGPEGDYLGNEAELQFDENLGYPAIRTQFDIRIYPKEIVTNGLHPFVDYVLKNPDGSFTAFWGYESDYEGVTDALQSTLLSSDYENVGTPPEIHFQPGRHQSVFSTRFHGDEVTWTLVSQNEKEDSCTAYAEEARRLAGIRFVPDQYSVKKDQQVQTVLKAYYAIGEEGILGDTLTAGVEYNSDNTSIAAIALDGKVTGIQKGQTVVAARYNGYDYPEQNTFSRETDSGETAYPSFLTDQATIDVTEDLPVIQPVAPAIPSPMPSYIGEIAVDNRMVRYISRGDVSIQNDILTINTAETGNYFKLSLYGNYVNEIAASNPKLLIRFNADPGSYELPLKLIDLNKSASELVVTTLEQRLEIVIDRMINDKNTEADEAAKAFNAKKLCDLVGFKVQLSSFSGSKIKEIPEFGQYVTRTINLKNSVDVNASAGMMYDLQAKTFYHVPTLFKTENGKSIAVIKSLYNNVCTAIAYEKSYSDIAHHWSKADVEKLSANLIVREQAEGLFAPGKSVTRAEFAEMLAKAMGIKMDSASVKLNSYITALLSNGGLSKLDAGITRNEITTIIYLAMKFIDPRYTDNGADENALGKFKDKGDIPALSRTEAQVIAKAGIIVGNDFLKFVPQLDCSRSEASAIIARFLKYVEFIN